VENTLYYTFSTIAQALAGVVAFLGAFVLFRLQTMSQVLSNGAEAIRSRFPGDEEIQRVAAIADYEKLFARASEVVRQPIGRGWGAFQQTALDGMHKVLAQRRIILRYLKRALSLAATVLVAAVVALSNVVAIASSPNLAVGTLVIGVVAFALRVVAIGVVVWRVAIGA
jgi:hypothetical protein